MNISFLYTCGLIAFTFFFSICTISKGENKTTNSKSISYDDDLDIAKISHDFVNTPVEVPDPSTVDGYDEATSFFAMHHIATKYFFEQKDKENLSKAQMKPMEFFQKSEKYKDKYEVLLMPSQSGKENEEFIEEVLDKAGMTKSEYQKLEQEVAKFLKGYEPNGENQTSPNKTGNSNNNIDLDGIDIDNINTDDLDISDIDVDIDVPQISHDFINMNVNVSDPTTVDGYDEATTFFAMHHIALSYFFKQKDKENLFRVQTKPEEFFKKSQTYKDEFEYLFFEDKDPEKHQEFIDEILAKSGMTQMEYAQLEEDVEKFMQGYKPRK